MKPTITCVVDNSARRSSDLWAEHGLAFWITTEQGQALLDTGQSGTVLLHNLKALDLDPRSLNALALSHAHYDHTGGLSLLAEDLAPDTPLYANGDLLRERFSRRGERRRSIGLAVGESWLRAHFALHLNDAPQELLPGIWTTGAITERPHPGGYVPHQEIRGARGYVPDPYRDDLSLVVESAGGLIVLCGCCHAGLLNTLEHVQRTFARPIIAVAGGTHLVSADSTTLVDIAERLANWEGLQRLYLNHCSGEDAYYTLRHILGSEIARPCPAGTLLAWEALG
ncbi:MAG: MBL fold metallo-hydrolase [Anaerolineales bacterium]